MASLLRPVSRIVGRLSRSGISTLESSARIPTQTTPALLSRSVLTTPKPNGSGTATGTGVSQQRGFSTSPLCLRAKTMGQLRARNATGPFSWKAALLFVLTGAGMIVYFRVEKERLERKRIAEMSKGVGKPKVGGPFTLVDLDGKEFTAEDLKGKYSFVSSPGHFFFFAWGEWVLVLMVWQVYFGFTHCPDICPDELDKMAAIIDKVKEATKGENIFLPVFITCDPARDSPQVLREYLKEFHPDIIGLTGTYEQVKHVCKQYRVYFSTPRDVKPGDDYLVDHSIYFYLMGGFLSFFALAK